MYEVNRSVFLLMPLEPFWAWLQSLPDMALEGLSLADLQRDANAYLVPPCDDVDDVWTEIETRYQEIFAAELADWCEDESLWPDVHPEVFNDWFDIQLSTVVTDLARQDLSREAFQPFSLN
ncbi:VacJ [Snodgrassella sp. CFCC 13594]|uniref:VacJ n=1 Tax=Snodgrassella sp. CFCC 13594 TaxID=1775559 RepID=UPI00083412CB|nr:VacJ [Snodgrassella sp. CFCC 13594]